MWVYACIDIISSPHWLQKINYRPVPFVFPCYIILLLIALIFFVNSFYSLHELLNCFSILSGANKSVYAPEPFDVGRILQADIVSNGQKDTLITAGPIGPGQLFSKFFVFLSYIFIPLMYWFRLPFTRHRLVLIVFLCMVHPLLVLIDDWKCWLCCF